MEALEQLQRQLGSLDDLRAIVKTMKALSAASIRQYEQAGLALGEYFRTVALGLQAVLGAGPVPRIARRAHGPRRAAAVVFGSDHGLCGRFNEAIAEYASERLSSLPVEPEARRVLAVGGRVAAALDPAAATLEEVLLVPGSAARIAGTVQRILVDVERWTEQGGVQEVRLFYNRHVRGAGHQPTSVALWPVDATQLRGAQKEPWPSRSLPTFTLDREQLLAGLLRQYLFVVIFRACAESLASEHASRLSAMQSAERNLDERLEEVTMLYRRARQEVITAELLDVVSGFEAASR